MSDSIICFMKSYLYVQTWNFWGYFKKDGQLLNLPFDQEGLPKRVRKRGSTKIDATIKYLMQNYVSKQVSHF